MEQLKLLLQYKELCLNEINSTDLSDDDQNCPPVWDGIMCWSSQEPNTLAVAKCPSYIHGFDPEAFVTKRCMEDGTWYINSDRNTTWTNYTLCSLNGTEDGEDSLVLSHMPYIKLISQVGYSLSLSILLVAFLILALFKKLRCPRNNLHMQLFLSFIMRAFWTLLKSVLFPEGIGTTDAALLGDREAFLANNSSNINCKIITSFWHYFLMANYCWILMEGLYLHNLVFLSMFTDTSGILKYVIVGWGLPVFFIIPWAVVRATLENDLCWTVNKNKGYFWIIRAPITASIVVNFVLFINITRVLFLKMFASQAIQSSRYRYRKWFKSTLVLVPLFGAHYAILLCMSLMENNQTVETVWLYLDQTFSSFQGFLVALLYCFFNGEVQAEMRKIYNRLHAKPNQPFRSHHSLLTQSLTYLSKGRSSIQSLHSMGDRRENYNTPNSVVLPTNKDTHLQTTGSQISPKASALSLGEDLKGRPATPAAVTELEQRPPTNTIHKTSPTSQSPWNTEKSLGNTEYENLLNEEISHRSEGSSFQKESIL